MKKITLEDFVEKEGSQEKAAHKIGVTLRTVIRWLNGETTPDPLAQVRLRTLGIKIPE